MNTKVFFRFFSLFLFPSCIQLGKLFFPFFFFVFFPLCIRFQLGNSFVNTKVFVPFFSHVFSLFVFVFN